MPAFRIYVTNPNKNNHYLALKHQDASAIENLYKISTYEIQYLQPEELQRQEESQLPHTEKQKLFLGHLVKIYTLYKDTQ